MRPQGGISRVPLGCAQLLGIVELACEPARHTSAEHHRRGHHRASQRPAPGFVHAGDAATMLRLETVMRHGLRLAWKERKEEPSFSEEKEAKRLLSF
jgi:hypothetical protein